MKGSIPPTWYILFARMNYNVYSEPQPKEYTVTPTFERPCEVS